jgi:hypothetical protein
MTNYLFSAVLKFCQNSGDFVQISLKKPTLIYRHFRPKERVIAERIEKCKLKEKYHEFLEARILMLNSILYRKRSGHF